MTSVNKSVSAQAFQITSVGDLLKDLTPQNYLIEDLLVQGELYSLTARNNHGKTTLAMSMASSVSRGGMFAGKRTEQGRVLILSGENTRDTLYKIKALGYSLDHDQVDVINGSFKLIDQIDQITSTSQKDYSLVIVDTFQAYGAGDTNSNSAQIDNAKACRKLTKLNGNPTVIVNAHPTKGADKTQLEPYGGGSLINEFDANLTLWLQDEVATLHHTKTRQPAFPEMKFTLKIHQFDEKNNFGGHMTSTTFESLTAGQAADQEQLELQQTNQMMALLMKPINRYNLAINIYGDKSDPHLSKIDRKLKKFREQGLVTLTNPPTLTKQGLRVAKNIM